MANNQLKHAIGTFPNRQSAEQALVELRETGFPMNKISVLIKNSDGDQQLGGDDPRERTATRAEGVKLGAAIGAAMGGLPALAGSLGVLFVPGVGPILAAESILIALLGSGAIAATGGSFAAILGLPYLLVSQFLLILELAHTPLMPMGKLMSFNSTIACSTFRRLENIPVACLKFCEVMRKIKYATP